MADTNIPNKVILPHSSEKDKIPQSSRLDEGELFINSNSENPFIGTKDSDGKIVSFAQLTPSQKEKLFDGEDGKFVPLKGIVNTNIQNNYDVVDKTLVEINDDSDNVIKMTMNANLAVRVNKTSGQKLTQLVIEKPQGVNAQITWQGIDCWRVVNKEPLFGDSPSPQTIIVTILTSPSINMANVVYNSEYSVMNDSVTIYWGDISGRMIDQQDLTKALNNKADIDSVNTLLGRIQILEQEVANLKIENASLFNAIVPNVPSVSVNE